MQTLRSRGGRFSSRIMDDSWKRLEMFALLCINNMILVVVLLKSATEAIGDLFTVYLCFKMSFSFCFVQIRECNIIPNFSP